jgi:hypothetical protein
MFRAQNFKAAFVEHCLQILEPEGQQMARDIKSAPTLPE